MSSVAVTTSFNVLSYIPLHSDNAKIHSTSSYQSLNDSCCLLWNLGNLLLVGPFLSCFSFDTFTCASVATADAAVDCWSEAILEVNVCIIVLVCCI